MHDHVPIPRTSSPETPVTYSDVLSPLRAGDPEAWDIAVEQYRNLLRHVVRRYRLTPDQSADVIQTTWLRFVENVHRIREPRAIGGWLATTASREAMAIGRQNRRETPTEILPDIATSVTLEVEDRLAAEWRASRLRAAIATLPPRERTLVQTLLDPASLSYQQISQRLDMPVGAIGPIRQRALRRLRNALAPVLSDAPWGDVEPSPDGAMMS